MSDHSKSAEEAAKAKGLVVELPDDNELFVDIDDAVSLETFHKQVQVLNSFRPCTWKLRPSPSGKPDRWHATVTLAEAGAQLTAIERIALQACLGSDRLHELLSLRALHRGDNEPTCFFEKPEPAPLNLPPRPIPLLPRYEP